MWGWQAFGCSGWPEGKYDQTEEPPTSIIQNKVVASTRLLIGGAGEDSSIFSIAISIGAKHNIQFKSGNPNKADGNCLYESIIDNINSRK